MRFPGDARPGVDRIAQQRRRRDDVVDPQPRVDGSRFPARERPHHGVRTARLGRQPAAAHDERVENCQDPSVRQLRREVRERAFEALLVDHVVQDAHDRDQVELCARERRLLGDVGGDELRAREPRPQPLDSGRDEVRARNARRPLAPPEIDPEAGPAADVEHRTAAHRHAGAGEAAQNSSCRVRVHMLVEDQRQCRISDDAEVLYGLVERAPVVRRAIGLARARVRHCATLDHTSGRVSAIRA